MKFSFLLFSIVIFTVASAQDNKYSNPLKKYKYKQPLAYKRPLPNYPLQTTPFSKDRLLLTLANGNKVYALSQDNMPCIIPDMSQFNMPNRVLPVYPYKYNGPGAIPNPVSNKMGFIQTVSIIKTKE